MDQPPRGRVLSPLLIAMLAVGLAAGFGAEYALTQPRLQQQDDTIAQLQNSVATENSTISQLQSSRASLNTRLNDTSASLASANKQLTAVQSQLTASLNSLQGNQSQLAKTQTKLSLVKNVTLKLNNDRILLGDLRTNPPTAKSDAVAYWQGVKTRAINVDPSLGPAVDNILKAINVYYDNYVWPLGNATTFQEVGLIYVGANSNGSLAYPNNISNFADDALLVIATDVNTVITLTTQ